MLISADTGSLNKKSFQARSGIGFWWALESERDDMCGICHKSKFLQKIHAYRWKYRTWTLFLCPNKNFQENQNITIAMLNLLGNTLIQSPCPKYGSGRNRCVESGLAIDATPVQINTAWLQSLVDGRANQFAKKTNGFCWSRNSKPGDKEVKHRWLLG